MSEEIRCNVDNLSDSIMKLLKDYGDTATKAINLAVEDEADGIRKKVRQNAGSAGIQGRRYKGGWQIKKENGPFGLQATVYNGSVPGLPHLLEKGHNVVAYGKSVGHAAAYSHIAPATQNMDTELEQKIQKNLDLLS